MGPKGPGRASIGSREGFRFIWTKSQPKRAHLGPNGAPFYFSISQKPILGPNSSKSSLGPGAIGPRAPSNMGHRAHGGRRPTFWRGVGGRSPPTATRGVWGGGSPPREKWTLELLPIAKSGTLQNGLGRVFALSIVQVRFIPCAQTDPCRGLNLGPASISIWTLHGAPPGPCM